MQLVARLVQSFFSLSVRPPLFPSPLSPSAFSLSHSSFFLFFLITYMYLLPIFILLHLSLLRFFPHINLAVYAVGHILKLLWFFFSFLSFFSLISSLADRGTTEPISKPRGPPTADQSRFIHRWSSRKACSVVCTRRRL